MEINSNFNCFPIPVEISNYNENKKRKNLNEYAEYENNGYLSMNNGEINDGEYLQNQPIPTYSEDIDASSNRIKRLKLDVQNEKEKKTNDYELSNNINKYENNNGCIQKFKINESDHLITENFNLWGDKIVVTKDSPIWFVKKLQTAINKIALKTVGRRLLDKIESKPYTVWIRHHTENDSYACFPDEDGPSVVRLTGLVEDPSCSKEGNPIKTPFFITLAHELIHAYHNSCGKDAGNKKVSDNEIINFIWSNLEEFNTIMGSTLNPQRKNIKVSENAIRAEHNIPIRYSHGSHKVLEKIGFLNLLKSNKIGWFG